MKRTILACFAGMLLSWTMTSVSYSQDLAIAKPGSLREAFTFSPDETGGIKNSDPIAGGEINTKAIKDFARSYKNVVDATWFKLRDGFVAYFTADGIKTRVFYNKRGKLEGSIRSYFEDKLPREIRHLVKSTYYDFSIYYVNEIAVDGTTAYLVKIEDKSSWKTIKVVNGEMEVAEEFIKR